MGKTESLIPQVGDAAERILAAAAQLFAQSGFDAVSINAIAELAGVSKANVFHHFSSKDDLYLAVLRAACTQSCAQLDQLESAQDSFAERLRHYASAHLDSIVRNAEISRLILREVQEGNPQRSKELAEQVFGANFARLVAILRAGQARGELRDDLDPGMIATLMIAADIFFFQSRAVSRHLPDVKHLADDHGAYSTMLMDILLHGIAKKQGEKT
ncbi:MAG: TetR/AcrR family transcriptional regulator [Pseudomonadota bacterium]